jgi:exoribonuclease II
MNVRKNDVIDYFDGRRISTSLVLEAEDRRLRILDEHGKEAKIAGNRVLAAGKDSHFPVNATRDLQVSRLKELSQNRDRLKNSIDLKELWEVVQYTDEVSLDDLCELLFGKALDMNSCPALLRAVFEDRLYFKIRPDHIEVLPPERVEQALIQKQKDLERTTFVALSAGFLANLKGKEAITADTAPPGLIPMLQEAAQFGKDWGTHKRVKDIFSQAGLPAHWDPFRVLVKLGVWSEDENIRLSAEDIPLDFSPQAEAEALTATSRTLPTSVEDLTAEHLITIDSAATRDLDDAISLSLEGTEFLVGIHITDVSHFVDRNSVLDKEVRNRATSIYLPEMTIPMIPRVLSEDAASLTVGRLRPVVSVMMRFGSDLKLKEYRICASKVRVTERLTYEDADERVLLPGSREAVLYQIAESLRAERVAAGAVIFKDPELTVRVNEDKAISVSVRDRETPAEILVSELMIVANNLFARFLQKRGLPGIFRSQPPPLEKIKLGDTYDPVLSYRCKKALSRGDLRVDPALHSTLGLDCYTMATSPLRRYTDLVVQRQIKAILFPGELLTRTDLELILSEISYRLERAALMERERNRYFLLKYLELIRHEEFEAVVLQRFPRFHLVHLMSLGLNVAMTTPNSLSLNPYDRVIIRVEKVNPRDDRLSFSLVRPL